MTQGTKQNDAIAPLRHDENIEGAHSAQAKTQTKVASVRPDGLSDASFKVGLEANVLEDAFFPEGSDRECPLVPEGVDFGWMSEGIARPQTGGFYLVEFKNDNLSRIVAYADRYGRVFETDEPFLIPPAKLPVLEFPFCDNGENGVDRGQIADAGDITVLKGEHRVVSSYEYRGEGYIIAGGWFDFGDTTRQVTYEEMVSRAYFAYVHRENCGGVSVPERGFDWVNAMLGSGDFVPAISAVREKLLALKADRAIRFPALAQCLLDWLDAAGFSELEAQDLPADAMRLIRTVANPHSAFVGVRQENRDRNLLLACALETGITFFLHTSYVLGDQAFDATREQCLAKARSIMAHAGDKKMDPPLLQKRSDDQRGEWAARLSFSEALESIPFSVRAMGHLRIDAKQRLAAVQLVVADLTPFDMLIFPELEDKEQRVKAASALLEEFSLRVGALLAGVLHNSCDLDRVAVTIGSFGADDDLAKPTFWDELETDREKRICLELTREQWMDGDRYFAVVEGGGEDLWTLVTPDVVPMDKGVFQIIGDSPSYLARKLAPEGGPVELSEEAKLKFGVESGDDLVIERDTIPRRMAERIANAVVGAVDSAEAVRAVRAVSEEASQKGYDYIREACTSIMMSLATGDIDTSDPNAIVSAVLGEDRCRKALLEARECAQEEPQRAIALLENAIMEAELLDGMVDEPNVVRRQFLLYSERIAYNLARKGQVELCPRAQNDKGKELRLVSDSYFLCHLDLMTLLEGTFDRADEATRIGKRAIQMAPASGLGYRHLARAYMLMGDMSMAESLLLEGLRVSLQAFDIAMCYYQLGYVLWKRGDVKTAAACYVRSIMVDAQMAAPATAELRELTSERGIEPPRSEDVVPTLKDAGIDIAPSEELTDRLVSWAQTAVDNQMFAAGGEMLRIALGHRSSDVLMNVLDSLGD